MIKVYRVKCKWCGKVIHGVVYRGTEVQCECSVCADSFTMPIEETKGNCEVDEFFDNLSFDDLKAKLREAGCTEVSNENPS